MEDDDEARFMGSKAGIGIEGTSLMVDGMGVTAELCDACWVEVLRSR